MAPARRTIIGRCARGACLAAVLAFLGAPLAPAQDAKSPLPEGVRHVPDNAWMFMHWRVGELLKTPIGKALWQQFSAEKAFRVNLAELEEKTGLSVNDVESVTLVVLEPPQSRWPGPQNKATQQKDEFFPPRFKEKAFPPDFAPAPSTQPLKEAPEPKRERDRKPQEGFQPIAFQQPWGMDHDDFDGPSGPEPLVIISTTKPVDRKKLLQAATNFDGPPWLDNLGFLFLSDRSLLVGSPRGVIQYADQAGKRDQAKGLLTEVLDLTRPGGGKGDALLAAGGMRSSTALKNMMFGPGPMPADRERAAVMAALYPLLNTSAAGVTVHFGNELTYALHLFGKTERSVTLALEAAKTMLAVAEVAVDKMLAAKEEEESAPYLKMVRDALGKATVTATAVGPEGARAELSVKLKADEKAIMLGLAAMVKTTRGASARTQSMNNLKQIGLALHSYHDVYKGLPPPAWSPKRDGKPLLSWRVAILPYVEQNALYQQFKHDEPWDSAHNMKLIEQMPSVYEVPGMKHKPGMTHYQVFTGRHGMFEHMPGAAQINLKLFQIPDGTSNTIMAAEAKEPVIWTKPDDLVYDPKGPLPKLGVLPNGFNVLMGDGTVRFIQPGRVPEATLRALITRDGGEVVPFDF